MIPPETVVEIRRLYFGEHWRVGTIAHELGLHHDTVRSAVETDRFHRPRPPERQRQIDPYLPFLRETLEKHPRLRATRLHEMLRQRGYGGSVVQLRRVVREMRPSLREPFLELRSYPGEQAQVDWASFGQIRVGRAVRKLSAFVLVFSHSRALWLEFFLDQCLESFLAGHVHALHDLGGVPRMLRMDNLKSAVLARHGAHVRFHPRYLELCAHYHVLPRPCDVRRGNQKGRVERAIRYVRDSFFAGREVRNLDQLNREARRWRDEIAHQRPWPGDRERTVQELLDEEQQHLLPLPIHPFETERLIEVRARKTLYVHFDQNKYSIPPDHVDKPLTLAATTDTIRILDGTEEVARHSRSWDRGELVEHPDHRAALVELKGRGLGFTPHARLQAAVPDIATFLAEAFRRGRNPGIETRKLVQLLDLYGARAFAEAGARRAGTPQADAVLYLLEKKLRQERRKPILPVDLSRHPDLADLHVSTHPLETYDDLTDDDD